jgi:hypothetical protein
LITPKLHKIKAYPANMTSDNKTHYTVESSAFTVDITGACVITAYATAPIIPQPSDLERYVIGVDG